MDAYSVSWKSRGWAEVFSDTINTGIYILEPAVFDFIPPGVDFDFSRDLFPPFCSGRANRSSDTWLTATGAMSAILTCISKPK